MVESAQTIKDAGNVLLEISEKRQKAKDDLDLVRAQSYAFREYNLLRDAMQKDPAASWDVYAPKFTEIQNNAANLIKNERIRERFFIGLDEENVRSQLIFNDQFKKRMDDEANATFIRDSSAGLDVAQRLAAGGDFEGAAVTFDQLKRYYQSMANSGLGGVTQTDVAAFEEKLKTETIPNVLLQAYNGNEEKLIERLTDKPEQIQSPRPDLGGDWQKDILPLIQKNEGGFVAIDGASGNPAVLGINREYHREAFNAIKAVYDTGNKEQAKKMAAEYLKKEFFDRYNLDRFPPDVKTVLADGVINHSFSFNQRLVGAAANGATANELIQMRDAEYARLGATAKFAPDLRGWQNRMNNVREHIGFTPVDYNKGYEGGDLFNLPFHARAKLLEDATQRYEKRIPDIIARDITFANPQQVESLINRFPNHSADIYKALNTRNEQLRKDPASFAASDPRVMQIANTPNATPENVYATMLAVQSELGVLPHEQSIIPEQSVTDIKGIIQNGSVDDIVKSSVDFVGSYGSLSSRAISDLYKKQGVPPQFISMVESAKTGDLKTAAKLASALQQGDPALTEVAKNMGKEIKDADITDNEVLKSYMEYTSRYADVGPMLANSKTASVKSLALYNATALNMSAEDALNSAVETLIPYEFKDGLAAPRNAVGSIDSAKRRLDETAVNLFDDVDLFYAIPELQERDGMNESELQDLAVRREEYKKSITENAVWLIEGDNYVLVDPSTNEPVLTSAAVFDNNTGRLLNPLEARIMVPIGEAMTFDSRPEPEVETLRSEIMAINGTVGYDVRELFNPRWWNGFKETFDFGDDIVSPTRVSPLDADLFNDPSMLSKVIDVPTRKAAKQRARENNQNFQRALALMPDDAQRQKLITAAIESNKIHEEYAALKKELSGIITPREAGVAFPSSKREIEIRERMAKLNQLKANGIGYNYIELPAWAKEDE